MRSNTLSRFARERVRGIFLCKKSAEHEQCQQLIEDLGCSVISQGKHRFTVESTRKRMQELKTRHRAKSDDLSQITSRLQKHFDNIIIGGPAR